MKYSLITTFALLSLSTAACLPKDHNSAEPQCTNAHASASIASITHSKPKPKHRSHSRHQKHHRPSTNSSANPSTTKSSTSVPASLVPEFGIQSGIDPSHGNCKGLNGILIPCACPPDRDAFIAKMAQFVGAGNAEGTPVSFPLDDSLDSQITRLTTSIVTLQNFNGSPGRGCPASSTTFVGQRAALLQKL